MIQLGQVFLTILCSLSFGFFSQFVRITPDHTENDIKVTLQKEEGKIDVSVDGISYKNGWIVKTARPILDGDQSESSGLRYFVWYKKKEIGSEGNEVTSLKDISKESFSENELKIQLELPDESLDRTYLYFDHPSEVMDGGFYYLIDLPKFLKTKNPPKKADSLLDKFLNLFSFTTER